MADPNLPGPPARAPGGESSKAEDCECFVEECECFPKLRKGFEMLEEAIFEDDKVMDKFYYGSIEDGEIDYECWNKHLMQIHESGGFDVEDFPNCLMRTFFPINNIGRDSRAYQLAAIALEHFNFSYKLVKVIKANGELVSGSMFYLTFEASKDDDSRTRTIFQAKVWDRIAQEKIEVQSIRVKTGGEGTSFDFTKEGTSTLNPYATSSIPLSQRAAVGEIKDLKAEGSESEDEAVTRPKRRIDDHWRSLEEDSPADDYLR